MGIRNFIKSKETLHSKKGNNKLYRVAMSSLNNIIFEEHKFR